MTTNKRIQDAGSHHIGRLGEVVTCTHCRTSGCDMCGGTGYRKICDHTVCHEHGCYWGTCYAERPEPRSPHENQ